MEQITAILNGYKRPHTLKHQYESIINQSIKPAEVMMWKNGTENNAEFPYSECPGLIVSHCTANLGVWARFAFALMAKTKYVCILDDDTIPGHNWFQNCIDTMKTHQGLLATIGVRFTSVNGMKGHSYRVGWDSPNDLVERVDWAGHAWFFEREWLSHYWRELPDPKHNRCGEDIHFSYILDKYLGLGTYVPPHPQSDKSLWGANPVLSNQYGNEEVSIWSQDGSANMHEFIMNCRAKGYKFHFER